MRAARTLEEAKNLYNEFLAITSKYEDADYRGRHHRVLEEDRETETDDDWSDDS